MVKDLRGSVAILRGQIKKLQKKVLAYVLSTFQFPTTDGDITVPNISHILLGLNRALVSRDNGSIN